VAGFLCIKIAQTAADEMDTLNIIVQNFSNRCVLIIDCRELEISEFGVSSLGIIVGQILRELVTWLKSCNMHTFYKLPYFILSEMK